MLSSAGTVLYHLCISKCTIAFLPTHYTQQPLIKMIQGEVIWIAVTSATTFHFYFLYFAIGKHICISFMEDCNSDFQQQNIIIKLSFQCVHMYAKRKTAPKLLLEVSRKRHGFFFKSELKTYRTLPWGYKYMWYANSYIPSCTRFSNQNKRLNC